MAPPRITRTSDTRSYRVESSPAELRAFFAALGFPHTPGGPGSLYTDRWTHGTGVDKTSLKKTRKPQARTLALRDSILAVLTMAARWTLRQLFYQCTVHGVLEKTEQAYKRLSDHLVQMRLDGTVPFEQIVDGHRMRRNTAGWASPMEAMETLIDEYTYDRWNDQPAMVEIWCEKDALSGQILPICEEYGVTYVACKGFASISLAHETAKLFARRSKPTYVYYFGDFDPSGMHIDRSLTERLRQFGATVKVERIALLPHQVKRYQLPTRPTKKSDSRAAGFVQQYGDAAIELDALPPAILEELVRSAIEQHIDWEAWQRGELADELQRQTLSTALGFIDTRPFAVGNRVRHAVFGDGTVVSIEPAGDDWQVVVRFADKGVKRLLASFAKLEKVMR